MTDTIIDPRVVDVTLAPDGSKLRGCNPHVERCGTALPVFEDEIELIPRDRWDDYLSDESPELLTKKIKDQLQEGSCAGNATTGSFEVLWNTTFGTEFWIEFSPISLYRWLADGPNDGSVIADNLKQLRDVGALPVDTPRNREILEAIGLNPNHVLKETGYYQTFPSGWQDTAKHFRCDEAWRLRSFAGVATALQRKYTVVYGRAGHAIFAVKLVKQNGIYYLKYTNSWGDWGELGANGFRGYGFDSEAFVSRAIPSYGAFAVRTPRITDQIFQWIRSSWK